VVACFVLPGTSLALAKLLVLATIMQNAASWAAATENAFNNNTHDMRE
jgi:hypothetical protein